MKQNLETMRYKVPKVKNRFLQTHIKLILICAVICAVLIMLSYSYVIIHQSYLFEPKSTILLFCEVEDYEETQKQLSKYDELCTIIFVKYEADLKNEDGSFDLSRFGSGLNMQYSTPDEDLLALAIPVKKTDKEFKFTDINLKAGSILDAKTVDSLIATIRSSL